MAWAILGAPYVHFTRAGRFVVKGIGYDTAMATCAFRDLYVMCASDAKVRQRTSEWISLMHDTTG
jgi:hypothetical protein